MNILIRADGGDKGGVLTWLLQLTEIFNSPEFTLHVIVDRSDSFIRSIPIPIKTMILGVRYQPIETITIFGISIVHIGHVFNNLLRSFYVGSMVSNYTKANDIDVVICSSVLHSPLWINNHAKLITFVHTIPNISNSNSYLRDLYLQFLCRRVDLFVAVSDSVKQSIGARLQSKTVVIHNFTDDLSYSAPDRVTSMDNFKLDDSNIYIGYIGTVSRNKGLEIAIRVLSKLRTNRNNIRLLIAGEAYKADDLLYKIEIELLIDKLNLRDFVIWLGNVDRKLFYPIPKIIMITTHGIVEAFSLVAIESMSAGKILIAPNKGGPTEIITNNFDGYLVDSGNVSQYAEIIDNVLNDNDQAIRIEANAKNTYLLRFSKKNYIEKLFNIIG